MAGIFGSGRQRDVSESEINPEAVERLTMLASMAIDQIPLPEPGGDDRGGSVDDQSRAVQGSGR